MLHMTDGALLAFHFSENSAPPNGFGVIPDFDDGERKIEPLV